MKALREKGSADSQCHAKSPNYDKNANSNPTRSANAKHPIAGCFCVGKTEGKDSNRAAVNDSPVGCQSRERPSPAGEVESHPLRIPEPLIYKA